MARTALSHAADTGGWSRDFNYDAFGNMWVTNATGIAAAGATAQGNYETGSNRMYGLGYDLAGNQLTANGDVLGYDAENRQVTVTERPSLGGGTEYIAYGGDGKRVAKSGPAGTMVYVYDALGQLAAEYSTVAGSTPCHTCYLIADHLGSTRLVTDENGVAVARHDFLPFGEEIAAGSAARGAQWGSGNDIVNQKFTGKERDSETGLDYFGARYYGSMLGRFASPDRTFGDQNIFDPQSWNLYTYVRNNPLRFVDRTGTQAQASELEVWIATHEPELAAAAKAAMAAKDFHTFAQAIKDAVWGSENPADKIQKAIESDNVGVAMEGIIGKLVANKFPGDVVDVVAPIPDPTNPDSPLTDIDVQLKYAMVEIKTGRRPVKLSQLNKQKTAGLPILVYAPQATPNQQRALTNAGVDVFRNLNLLFDALQRLKGAAQEERPTILRRPKIKDW